MSKIDEKIVLVGGGGGVYRVARFLKHIRTRITTIQTMFDHGGHSGKLRDERGTLPPGDIRQAILALSNDKMENSLRALLSYRFPAHNGSSIDNATMGNLMLTALIDICGNPISGIEAMCQIFQVTGKVLPVSLDNADLCVKLSDGSTVKGEGLIDTRSPDDDRLIVSAYLEPKANIYTGAYDAIVEADKVVFCFGDLFTSIIPTTLVDGFEDAIGNTKAKLIYAVNIMTKKSETHGYSASKFASTLLSYIKRDRFDVVICNKSGSLRPEVLKKYAQEKAEPVLVDGHELKQYTAQILEDELADQQGNVIRHNAKVASLIAQV